MKNLEGKIAAISPAIQLKEVGEKIILVEIITSTDTTELLVFQHDAIHITRNLKVGLVFNFLNLRKVRLKDDSGFEALAYTGTSGNKIEIISCSSIHHQQSQSSDTVHCVSPDLYEDEKEEPDGLLYPANIPTREILSTTYFNLKGTIKSICPLGWICLSRCILTPTESELNPMQFKYQLAHCKVYFPHYYPNSQTLRENVLIDIFNILPIYLWNSTFVGFASTMRTSTFTDNIYDSLPSTSSTTASTSIHSNFTIPPTISERCVLFTAWYSILATRIPDYIQKQDYSAGKYDFNSFIMNILDTYWRSIECDKIVDSAMIIKHHAFLREFQEPMYSELYIVRNGLDHEYICSLLPQIYSCLHILRTHISPICGPFPRQNMIETASSSSSSSALLIHDSLLIASICNFVLLPSLLCINVIDATGRTLKCYCDVSTDTNSGSSTVTKLAAPTFDSIILIRNPHILRASASAAQQIVLVCSYADVTLVDLAVFRGIISRKQQPSVLVSYINTLADIAAYALKSPLDSSFIYKQPQIDSSRCEISPNSFKNIRNILATDDASHNLYINCIGILVHKQINTNASQMILTIRDVIYADTITVYTPIDVCELLLIGFKVTLTKCKLISNARRRNYLLYKESESTFGLLGVSKKGLFLSLDKVGHTQQAIEALLPCTPPPRISISTLFNSKRQSRCGWQICVRIMGVKRVSAAYKCSKCHSMGSAQLDGHGLTCRICNTGAQLILEWEVMLEVDDGTCSAVLIVETASVDVLFSHRDRVLVEALLEEIKQRCEVEGCIHVEGQHLRECALKDFEIKHDTFMASHSDNTKRTAATSAFYSEPAVILQHLVILLLYSTDLFEVNIAILKYDGKGKDEAKSRFGMPNVRVQKTKTQYASDYIEYPTLQPDSTVLSAISIQKISTQNDICLEAHKLLSKLSM